MKKLSRILPALATMVLLLVVVSVGHAQTPEDPVLVANTGQAAGSDLATATDRAAYAQSFTTGSNPDGYFLSSVEVGLKAGSGVTAEVALWWSYRTVSFLGTGYFFYPIRMLTTLPGVSSIDNDASTLERFSANDVLLLPGRTYWIVVTRTGGADDGLSVATTSSGDAVDASGMAGYSVGTNVWVPHTPTSIDPDGPRWADYSGSVDASMKIRLRGSEATRPPGPYVTNRNELSRAAPAETSAATPRYATSFTTTFESDSDTHELTSVLLGVAAEPGVSPRVAIHADNSGSPAASAVTNGTLTAPADVSRILGAPDRAEFTASTAIPLAEGTRYWVVLDVGSGSGSLSVSTTTENDNDFFSAGNWSIGDTMKAYRGTSWSNDSQRRSFRMALNGPTQQVRFISPKLGIGLPQVGVGVAAEIQDLKFEDVSFRVKNATWQWQRGETSDGTFSDIPAEQGGTSRVYVPAAADLGKWLKALVAYENAFGLGKSLSGVSHSPVLSQPVVSNAGQISDIGYVVTRPDAVRVAQAFTTGGNPSGYSLSGLRFGTSMYTDANALSWALHADAAGEPASAPLFADIAVPSDSLDDDIYTFEDLVHPRFVLAPDTKYWAVLTASSLMEGNEATLALAGISEWGDKVILDGPAAELDPGSEPGWTLDFSTLSSPTDTTSPEEWVPFAEALEIERGKMVLRMSVLTYPEVTASFGQAAYTVDEGGTQTVTVTLSADPERSVIIPIIRTNQDGASNGDYSGVPANVAFSAGETEAKFTFTATQDLVDDDGESVLLGFGALPGGVSAGTLGTATVNITDDDVPDVSFGESTYWVAEGDVVSVEVTLTSALTSVVTVPITHSPQDSASSADYSGVPANVTFNAGETSKTFTFTAATDDDDDDGESVLLGFGPLPATVQTGTTTQSTITITVAGTPAGCQTGDLWCATVVYSGSTASNATEPAGRKLLVWGTGGGDTFQFAYKGNTYEVLSGTLGPNPGGGTYVRPPFHIPERSKALLSVFHYRPEERQIRWVVPNQDYLDWTLYISTGTGDDLVEARLPLNEAKFCCGHSWRWHGLDLYHLNDAWTATKEYRLRIAQDLPADRTPEVLGPPLHLRTPGATRHNALVHWVRPQMRNDAAPPGVSYKVQWKNSDNNWDAPGVLEQVYMPPSGQESLSRLISGLTANTSYDARVIAVNKAGDSAPSNVLSFQTDPIPSGSQNQADNTPATGGPGISGTVRAGETLTATTDGIEDEDGLSGAVFAYQWVRRDLETFDDTDIEGAIGSTYTVTDADEGRAIKVRVTFTDDGGNQESLTSNAHLSAPPLVIPDEEETPLTATIHDEPSSHDEQDAFTFELRFSEEPKEDFSYKTLKDHAFTVTGGEVDGARRLVSGSNIRWEITVSPDSNADVTVKLPATEDCEAQGAICTGDGRMLSRELELTVSGPDSQQAANTPATGEPSINGTAQVGQTLAADTAGIADGDGLDNASFSYQWQADGADISGATGSSYTLSEDDVGRAISVKVSFSDDAGNEESLTSAATGAVGAKPNAPATGAPSINGTAQVGETLGADTAGIADGDGLVNASFSYQWMADDTDIAGATSSTHTLLAGDEGQTIKVRVSFTDDAGNPETLTSAATEAVQPRPNSPVIRGTARVGETLVADTSEIYDPDGLQNAVFAYRWIAGGADIEGATGSSYTIAAEDEGLIIRVWVSFTDDAGNQETRTSEGTEPVQPLPNTPATGTPTIMGTARVGETLTVDTSGISDAEGMENAVFTYRWMAGGADIPGATGASHTLTADDEGLAVRVWVSFTDDGGNPEAVTSEATGEAAPRPPLTATIHDAPESHDGQEDFTFELRFSEEIKEDFSYETLKDHAFTVTGGTVAGARRLVSGSNIGWEISVSPESNGDVTVKLPATEDCGAQGAICTGDGRMLSEGLEFTVSRPGS